MWSLAKNWSILWIFSFISGAYLVVQKEDEQMMIFFRYRNYKCLKIFMLKLVHCIHVLGIFLQTMI